VGRVAFEAVSVFHDLEVPLICICMKARKSFIGRSRTVLQQGIISKAQAEMSSDWKGGYG
jgi:hypothetical protein